MIFKAYLEIGSKILGDKGTITLTENCDLLLNVFYVVFCFFQINNLNGHNFLSPFVDAFKNFTKRAFPYPFQLGEKLLRISSEILCVRQDGQRETVCILSQEKLQEKAQIKKTSHLT